MTAWTVRPLPVTPVSMPVGAARVPGFSGGVDLTEAGYIETEYLVTGAAHGWAYDAGWVARRAPQPTPVTTRVLVRSPPADRFNGVLQVEPLHPNLDQAPTWRMTHPWIMRTGAAWLGITQDPISAQSLSRVDPNRYADVRVPSPSLRYEVVAGIVQSLRAGELALLTGLASPDRVFLSGWSMTGSFCRVFIGEGFHERHRRADGRPVFDGYLIGISSGGASRSGYPPLDGQGSPVPMSDPRRAIGGHDVPVFKVLSELESETHFGQLRPDSDEATDRYRLYQVAGTSHDTTGPRDLQTNGCQFERAGVDTGSTEINEHRSDARLDYVARAIYARLDDWVRTGRPAPRAERFHAADQPFPGERVPVGARPLRRDTLGNVAGGIRTPWVEVPLARYLPHSTPVPGRCRPSPAAPMTTPEAVAAMVGHMDALPAERIRDRYGSAEGYLDRFDTACQTLAMQGFLQPEESQLLQQQARRTAYPDVFATSNQ